MDQIEDVYAELQTVKGESAIIIKLKEGLKESKVILTNQVAWIETRSAAESISGCWLQDEISLKEWHTSMRTAHKVSSELLQRMGRKAIKIYGVNHDPMLAEHQQRPGSGRTSRGAFLARASSLDSGI